MWNPGIQVVLGVQVLEYYILGQKRTGSTVVLSRIVED
jgi:hypothetical protein